MTDFKNLRDYTDEEIHERVRIIKSKSLSMNEKDCMKRILGMIDLTTLEGSDNDEKIIKLCEKAESFKNIAENIPAVAAVCVYPVFVSLAKSQLKDNNIKVASVAGAFPSGQSPLPLRLAEIQYAVDEGAEEIDMVISRGRFLAGDETYIFDEIAAMKEICKHVHLKVIIETGELQSFSNIYKASMIAMHAGADFIKTSTGKIVPAATEQAVLVMLDAIKDYYESTGKITGMKPAGGISETATALNYYKLLENTLDIRWHQKEKFRFGASKLADNLLNEILTGKNQNHD